MAWNPGSDPFPDRDIKRITDFGYLDELKFVCHAQVHVKKVPESLWQLAGDFRARMMVHPKQGSAIQATLTAPRGMFTDLSSVPEVFWSIVGPIGPHLEASIIHDYLYMAWTDFRAKAVERDWDFADEVLRAGMTVSGVKPLTRKLIYNAVHSDIGWAVFKKKTWTLKARMAEWLPLLDPSHGR